MNNNYYGYPYYNYIPDTRAIPTTPIINTATRSPLSFLTSRATAPALTGVAKTATSKITFSGILNGASKTLGVINQAIPVVYQIKPIWTNAKTMFRMAKAINSTDKKQNTNNITQPVMTKEKQNENNPTFFA